MVSGQGLATGSNLSVSPCILSPSTAHLSESFGFYMGKKCLATGSSGACGWNIPHLLLDQGLSVAKDLNLALASCSFL